MFLVKEQLEAQALASLDTFSIETPSWGYADTGTRFGKFRQPGAAITFSDKASDAKQVHRFTGCCPKLAVHVLWDLSEEDDGSVAANQAKTEDLEIGSINANTFQDQVYKFGSFANPDPAVRRQALKHVKRCLTIAENTSKVTTLWFADGTNYPGQDDVRARKRRFEDGLAEVASAAPEGHMVLLEYKPFEPAFYQTDVADWGMAAHYCRKAGGPFKVLVDTGHHYLSQNVEQIVAWLLDEGMLGGFHFNDRRYADDDLTLGSIDPYQIFRIFAEIHGFAFDTEQSPHIEYMIDQSHNLKPKVEAMIQTVCRAQELYVKAALVDFKSLREHQRAGNLVDAEEELQRAFRQDVTPLLAQWRKARGLPEEPLAAFRADGYADRVAAERQSRREAAGPTSDDAYA
ncbi:MAG: TIM barrel protein [Fimbriimonadaceae bacterium]